MKRVNIRCVKQSTGELVELYLENGLTGGRLLCSPDLVPVPGRYLLAHDGSDDPLPAPVFNAGPSSGGFLVAPPIPRTWQPGITLTLRGPLGRGFILPDSARHVALVPLEETFARLKPLLGNALKQGASVVLVSDLSLPDLPPEVELHPLSALAEIAHWLDYLAVDIAREFLPKLRQMLEFGKQVPVKFDAQVLVRTPMPCGALAECGVCAVTVRRSWKMTCKNGPVFSLSELI